MRLILPVLLAGFAPPALARDAPVGTGWSRASDLSVYGALRLASGLAQEQEVLCAGRNPARVEDRWRAAYAAREAWIADALRARYGQAAVARAGAAEVGRITCPAVTSSVWRRHHHRMLHLLEYRLVPRDHFRRAGP